jgi:2-oxoglutarate dehydrogenase complex dehydrogenase (E1) component-like enzyme
VPPEHAPIKEECRSSTLLTLPILIHGDASFPGQGIVAETLNLSRLPGYWTGGTIHLITNNQLGYTTLPVDARSTLYASDLAKGFEIPVVHINADDPEACVEAARLAFAYRAKFQKDFLIDLVGYRRWGHNEGDDPSITQPTMYQIGPSYCVNAAPLAGMLTNGEAANGGTPGRLSNVAPEKHLRAAARAPPPVPPAVSRPRSQ